MVNTQRTVHSSPSRNAVLFGLAVGASGFATGCDAPETGSLENAKRGAAVKPAPVDYTKLDYSKIDYSKLDYTKLDPKKIDPSTVNLDTLSKERLTAIVEKNVTLVSSQALADESMRRLTETKAFVKDEKVVAQIDSIIKAMEPLKSIIGENLCW
jgi:hypothetical protein